MPRRVKVCQRPFVRLQSKFFLGTNLIREVARDLPRLPCSYPPTRKCEYDCRSRTTESCCASVSFQSGQSCAAYEKEHKHKDPSTSHYSGPFPSFPSIARLPKCLPLRHTSSSPPFSWQHNHRARRGRVKDENPLRGDNWVFLRRGQGSCAVGFTRVDMIRAYHTREQEGMRCFRVNNCFESEKRGGEVRRCWVLVSREKGFRETGERLLDYRVSF